MRKNYIIPVFESFDMESQKLMAGSMKMNLNNNGVDQALSKNKNTADDFADDDDLANDGNMWNYSDPLN